MEGRLQTRSWESNGQKKSVIEVVANRVQFLRTKKKETVEEPLETTEQEGTYEETPST